MVGLISMTILSVYLSSKSISSSLEAAERLGSVQRLAAGPVGSSHAGEQAGLSFASAFSLGFAVDTGLMSRESLVAAMVHGTGALDGVAAGPVAPWDLVVANEASASAAERQALLAEGEMALTEVGSAAGDPLLFLETGLSRDDTGLGIIRSVDAVLAAIRAAGGDVRLRLFIRAPLPFGKFYSFAQEYPASWLDRWQRGGWDASVSVMAPGGVFVENAAEQRTLERRGASVPSRYRKRHAAYVEGIVRTVLNRTDAAPTAVLGAADYFRLDNVVVPNPIPRLLTVVAEAQLIAELGGGVTDGALRVVDGSLLCSEGTKAHGVHVAERGRRVSRGVLAWYPPGHAVPRCVVDLFQEYGESLLSVNVSEVPAGEAEGEANVTVAALRVCGREHDRCLEELLAACHVTTGEPNRLDEVLSEPGQGYTEPVPRKALQGWPEDADEAAEAGYASVDEWQHPVRWRRPATRVPCHAYPSHYAKCAPSFLLLGAEKAGTTYFLTALSSHPQVVRPLVGSLFKEVGLYHRFFVEGRYKEEAARWAVTPYIDGERDSLMWGDGFVYYLDDRVAAERAVADNPEMRYMVLLREPATRALSGYRFSHRDYTRRNVSFPEVVRARMNAFAECLEAAAVDEEGIARYHECRNRQPPVYDGHQVVSLGLYAFQLAYWLHRVPRERVDIYFFDELVEDPDAVLRRAEVFLGLDTNDGNATAAARQNSAKPMGMQAAPSDDEEVQKAVEELRDFYAPYNELLRKELGIALPESWS